MGFFRRETYFDRLAARNLKAAIAQIAANQPVPITFADRFAAVCDAIKGAPEEDAAAMIRPILALIKNKTLRREVLRTVQEDTWGDVE